MTYTDQKTGRTFASRDELERHAEEALDRELKLYRHTYKDESGTRYGLVVNVSLVRLA